MNIKVWSNFSKRINSTKQPTGGTQKTVLLKDETDIERPTFILDTLDFSINYVEAFGHYYFAHCRNLDGHRTAIECDIDLLATYKANIQSYSGLVEYTSSSSRKDITDPRNHPTCENVILQSTVSTGLPLNSEGSYILGVVGTYANGSSGVVQYYSMTKLQMTAFCAEVFQQGGIIDDLIQQFTDSMNAIVSCIWLPFPVLNDGAIGDSNPEKIQIGGHTLNAEGYRIKYRLLGPNTPPVLSITWPMQGTYGKTYLDRTPYTTGSLYLPFVGAVPLDVDALYTCRKMTIDFIIDVITGDIIYDAMYTDDNADYRVSTYTGNVATKVPVSGQSYDAIGLATGAMTLIGGIAATAVTVATGGSAAAVAAGVGAAAGGLGMGAKSCELHSMVNGSASSALGAALGVNISATLITQVPAETNLTGYQAEQGMPYFQTASLSGLSGYVKCANASVECAASESEKQTINGYLNSGFYLE